MSHSLSNPGSRPRDFALLVFGVFACSLSVIFLKDSQTHPIWLAGIRVLVAAVFLTPLLMIEARKDRSAISFQQFLRCAPGGVLLALHFITWTQGARTTTATNGSLIVNLSTVVMPLIMWFMNRERITRMEIIGTLVALTGVLVLVLVRGEKEVSGHSLVGDVVCFVSMVLYCFYMAFGRRNGVGRSLWLYVVPLYYICGFLCVATALVTPGVPLPPLNLHEIQMLVCLGLIPTVMGHSIMNWCIKSMRGQIVATANLFQFVFAGLIAYLRFDELPVRLFYPMCLLIVIGSLIVIRGHRRKLMVDAES